MRRNSFEVDGATRTEPGGCNERKGLGGQRRYARRPCPPKHRPNDQQLHSHRAKTPSSRTETRAHLGRMKSRPEGQPRRIRSVGMKRRVRRVYPPNFSLNGRLDLRERTAEQTVNSADYAHREHSRERYPREEQMAKLCLFRVWTLRSGKFKKDWPPNSLTFLIRSSAQISASPHSPNFGDVRALINNHQ